MTCPYHSSSSDYATSITYDLGFLLLVGEDLQAIKEVGSRTVLEAAMVSEKEKVNQTVEIMCEISETVNVPFKKQKYVQLSLF